MLNWCKDCSLIDRADQLQRLIDSLTVTLIRHHRLHCLYHLGRRQIYTNHAVVSLSVAPMTKCFHEKNQILSLFYMCYLIGVVKYVLCKVEQTFTQSPKTNINRDDNHAGTIDIQLDHEKGICVIESLWLAGSYCRDRMHGLYTRRTLGGCHCSRTVYQAVFLI